MSDTSLHDHYYSIIYIYSVFQVYITIQGGTLQKFGYQTRAGKFLFPEEALFLLEQVNSKSFRGTYEFKYFVSVYRSTYRPGEILYFFTENAAAAKEIKPYDG